MNVTEASKSIPTKIASQKSCESAWSEICKSSPSDHIYLNHAEDMAICSLWQKDASKVEAPPSDIFFAGTVPILDCILTVDETDCVLNNGRKGIETSARVVILEDYKEIISKNKEVVGYLILDINGSDLIWPIGVSKGYDLIITGDLGIHNIPLKMIAEIQSRYSQADMCAQMYEWMTTWYGIQIALLHPTVKTIFQHSEAERIYNPSHDKKKDKRVTCYVKKHVIKSGDVESAMRGGEHNFTRKTMVWYVIGHWRNYSDGRKVFVHPYWKGPLRELKQNIDDGRERQIALGGDSS